MQVSNQLVNFGEGDRISKIMDSFLSVIVRQTKGSLLCGKALELEENPCGPMIKPPGTECAYQVGIVGREPEQLISACCVALCLLYIEDCPVLILKVRSAKVSFVVKLT
jgi:hypothetical protein